MSFPLRLPDPREFPINAFDKHKIIEPPRLSELSSPEDEVLKAFREFWEGQNYGTGLPALNLFTAPYIMSKLFEHLSLEDLKHSVSVVSPANCLDEQREKMCKIQNIFNTQIPH